MNDKLAILWRGNPLLAVRRGLVVQALIGQKEEKLVLDDGAANTAGVLAIVVLNAYRQGVTRATPLVVGVEVRILIEEYGASVELIGSALGRRLDLGAAAAAIFRVIVARDNGHILDRFGVRRHHSGAAPSQAIHVDPVDEVHVLFDPLAAGTHLDLIFGLEDGGVRSTRSGSVTQGDRSPGSTAATCAGDARHGAD